MSILDYQNDDTVEVIGQGDGWSIWKDRHTLKHRFDVSSDTIHRCAPVGGPLTKAKAYLAVDTLAAYLPYQAARMRDAIPGLIA